MKNKKTDDIFYVWIFAVAIYCNGKQAVYGRAYEIHTNK